ncbi:unnamed protein product, partial [Larinioides sclopetarius]
MIPVYNSNVKRNRKRLQMTRSLWELLNSSPLQHFTCISLCYLNPQDLQQRDSSVLFERQM